MIKACLKIINYPLILAVFLLSSPVMVMADEQKQQARIDDTVEIMEVFNQQAIAEAGAFGLTDKEKHKILFFMGIALLLLLCTTAYLGISMVVFNQEVFVRHMISAGLTVTLGLAHAVAAIVWFFPF